MAKRIPTQVGDVLVVHTSQSFTIYAVGQVSKNDQQEVSGHMSVKYVSDPAAAMAEAKALVKPGRRIFFRNIDTGAWSEIPHER